MAKINLTKKGLKQFLRMQARYADLIRDYPNTAADRLRFENGNIVGELVDLAMGYNGSNVDNLLNSGLAEYKDNGRWAVDHMGAVING